MARSFFSVGRGLRCGRHCGLTRWSVKKSLFFALALLPAAAMASDCPPPPGIADAAGSVPYLGVCSGASCGTVSYADPVAELKTGDFVSGIIGMPRPSGLQPGDLYEATAGNVSISFIWDADPDAKYRLYDSPRHNCSYSSGSPDQQEPKSSFPADVPAHSGSGMSYGDIVAFEGGEGRTDTYGATATTNRVYTIVWAPDYTPAGGGSERKNSCSAPGLQNPLTDGSTYAWCGRATGIAREGNYVVYQLTVPRDCADIPGYELSVGNCVLLYEALTKKPANIPCEVHQKNGSFVADPRNPACSRPQIFEVSESRFVAPSVEVSATEGDSLRVDRYDPTADRWSSVDLGPWSPSGGGRPVTGVTGGSGRPPGSGGGNPGGGNGDGGGGGDGDGTPGPEPDWNSLVPDVGDVMSPLTGPLQGLMSFTIDLPAGECPIAEFDALDRHYVIDQHCGLLEDNRLAIQAMMLAVWSLMGALIILRA